jgi:hydrolase, NUDIX family
MFINPEELLLQKSEVDVPARAYGAHMKWQELYSKIVQ